MALVCFKNTLGKQSDFEQIDKPTLMTTILEFTRKTDEFCDLVTKQKMVVYLNGKSVKVDDWQITEVISTDEIVLSPAILGGENAGWINVAIGVAMIVAGVVTGGNPVLIMTGAAMVLGGISSLLFEPDLPKLPSRSSSSQTYNWNGISTNSKTDIPVPIIYGTHSVGGNIISLFTQTRNYDEYLYVLLGLSEGEIEGIYKADTDTEEIMTEYYCDEASTYSPDILIDGQPIKYYSDWEMWWRPGINPQDQIPGFDGTKLLYQVGDEVTENGMVYRTQGEVDLVTCTLHCPALYTVDGGEIKPYRIKYKIQYKAAASGTYTDLPITKYTPYTASASSGGQIGECTTVSYKYGREYWYATSLPQSVTVEIISNSFSGLNVGTYVIKMDIYSQDGTLLNEGLEITNSIRSIRTDNPNYVSTGSAKGDYDAGQAKYIYVTRDTPLAFNAGVYTIKLSGGVSSGNQYTISSLLDSNSEEVVVYDKTKTGLTSVVDINFRSLDLDQGVYDLRFTRTDGGESDDFSTENKLILESVLEQVQGKYTYPHTALLALKLKATGQISGNVPSMVTKIRGKKISVPALSGSEDFDDCYWDGSSWRVNEVGSPIRTWDGSTWEEEYSHNSMLCVRDLVTSQRYGLGKYMTATDLNTVGVNEAIQECHRWYNEAPSHFHRFDGVLESEQTALTVINEMCSSFRVWPVWMEGALDFVIDKDTTPVHTVAKSNTISFSQSFVPLSEIPYKVYGQYTDEDNDYDMRSLLALSNEPNLLELNETTIGLKGITNFDRASRELKFKLNKVINCTETINFKCGLDKIHAAAGDLIYIQNDLPQWGYGGRIVEYSMSAASILTDEPIYISSTGISHTLRFVDENGETLEATLALGSKSNDSYYRTFPLVSHVGTPADDAVFTIGKTGGEPKKFRIMSISRSVEDEVDITALEHLDELYDEPDIGIVEDDYSDLPNPNEKPGLPRVMSVTSYDEALGFYIKALPPIGSNGVIGITVQISTNNISFTDIGVLTSPDWFMLYTDPSLQTNTTYYFRLFCTTATKQGDYVIAEAELLAPEYVITAPTGIHIKGKTPNVQTFNGRDVAIAWNPAGMLPGQSSSIQGYLVDIFHLADRSDIPSAGNFKNTYTVNSEEFEYTFEENDRNTNGTGIGWPTIAFIVYTLQTNGGFSVGSVPFVVNNTIPNPVQNLSARAFMAQAQFWWTKVNIPDFASYEYRYKIESFGTYNEWEDTLSPNITIGLTSAERELNYDDIYLDVRVRDIFNQTSALNTIIQTTDSLYVPVTDVDGFEEDMSGNFFYIPVLDADSWTNNSPTSTAISWNAHSVWLNGTSYAIAAGNTTDTYIYWENLSGSYSTSNTHPGATLVTDQDFIIGTNASGVFKRAWGAIPNQAIGSAYIQNAAIQDAHVDDLSAAKIRAGTIMTPGVFIGDAVNSDGVAIDDISASAADWNTLPNIPDRFKDTPGVLPGLYITASSLGYYNGTQWRSYIDYESNVFFGNATDFFTYRTDSGLQLSSENASALVISGGGDISLIGGATPGKLIMKGASDSVEMYMSNSDDCYLLPLDDGVMDLYIGGISSQKWQFINLYSYGKNYNTGRIRLHSEQRQNTTKYARLDLSAYEIGTNAELWSYYNASVYARQTMFTSASQAYIQWIVEGTTTFTLYNNRITFRWDLLPSVGSSVDIGSTSYRIKTIYAVNALNTSDLRLKTEVHKSELGLDFLDKLNPISFKLKENKDDRTRYGLIAQEVESVLKDLGYSYEDFCGLHYDKTEDVWNMDYIHFIAPLINAVQELNKEVKELKQRIE